MLAKNILYYGKDEPLPERVNLRAGPLSVVYENGDLRNIQYGSREVLRRVYVAIRDRNWGTIPPVFSDVRIEQGENSFRISYQVENKQGDIDFAWTGTITGEPDGAIHFRMDGLARSTFMKNRIGFCVLHPAGCAGAASKVEHVDGTRSSAEFPLYLVSEQPVPPFAEMRSITHQVEPGVWVEVAFTGDIFEMEDQRNWTDASYKTFCTPLRIPYPVEVQAGTPISQAIDIRLVRESVPAVVNAQEQSGTDRGLSLAIDGNADPIPLPPIGLGVSSSGQKLSQQEIDRLKKLNLDHLRVDADLSSSSFIEVIDRAAHEAQALGVQLDIALLVPEDGDQKLRALAASVAEKNLPVRTWLVYPASEKFLGGSLVREAVLLARKYLNGVVPGAKFAAGTNTDFIFLQRTPAPVEDIDLVTFSINPQVHAFDNTSIVETLEAQPQAVATARIRSQGLPVMVSPVTLKMRFNPYATGPTPDIRPGELPPQVDVRQMSMFGAAWTAGSIAVLAQSQAASLTYYETSGSQGIMESAHGSPVPEVFHSYPGCVYPMYHVFAAVGAFAGGEVISAQPSDSMTFSGLVLRKGDQQRVILANMTPETQAITLEMPGSVAVLHSIDERNVEQAMCSPEEFLSNPGVEINAEGGAFKVQLLPFAVAWLNL